MLDSEVQRWSAMSCERLVSELHDLQAGLSAFIPFIARTGFYMEFAGKRWEGYEGLERHQIEKRADYPARPVFLWLVDFAPHRGLKGGRGVCPLRRTPRRVPPLSPWSQSVSRPLGVSVPLKGPNPLSRKG